MNIHRGDKLETLVAFDTKSVNGLKLVQDKMGLDECANGDYTITLLSTANGKMIEIHHNVMTPRPYDRKYQLTGTEGFANKYPVEGFAFEPENISSDEVPDHEDLSSHSFVPEAARKALMEKYMHPIHREVGEIAKKVGGHGGMDFVMDYRLVYCLRNGLPLDMDVYDAAEWSCVGELGAVSMFHGNMPVEVPDFTRGRLPFRLQEITGIPPEHTSRPVPRCQGRPFRIFPLQHVVRYRIKIEFGEGLDHTAGGQAEKDVSAHPGEHARGYGQLGRRKNTALLLIFPQDAVQVQFRLGNPVKMPNYMLHGPLLKASRRGTLRQQLPEPRRTGNKHHDAG